jgi:hypothetical protein
MQSVGDWSWSDVAKGVVTGLVVPAPIQAYWAWQSTNPSTPVQPSSPVLPGPTAPIGPGVLKATATGISANVLLITAAVGLGLIVWHRRATRKR